MTGRKRHQTVDLKWSLWTADPDDEAWVKEWPTLMGDLRRIPDGESLWIHSAPRKEIRFGEVVVSRDGESLLYRGVFWEEYDDDEPIDARSVDFRGRVAIGPDPDGFNLAVATMWQAIDQAEDALLNQLGYELTP